MRHSDCLFRVLFHSFTFSVKHLGDVQELLSNFEGSVQVANGVILQGDTVTVGLDWVCHETTKKINKFKNLKKAKRPSVIIHRKRTEMGFISYEIDFMKPCWPCSCSCSPTVKGKTAPEKTLNT